EARQRVTDENRGARGGDCHAAANEEPCADDAADGDHRHVPRPQRAAEPVLIRRGVRHCVHHGSPVSAAPSAAANGRGPGSTEPATGWPGPEAGTRQANSRLRYWEDVGRAACGAIARRAGLTLGPCDSIISTLF